MISYKIIKIRVVLTFDSEVLNIVVVEV